MATGTIQNTKAGVYIGPTIVKAISMAATGIQYADLGSDVNPPPTVPGYTFKMWLVHSTSYRFVPFGIGGSDRLFYYVGTAYSSPVNVELYPLYVKT